MALLPRNCQKSGGIFDNNGKILALDISLYADGGWSLDLSTVILSQAMFHIDNA
jgi:xanthine dehydrogenase large subunit